MRTRTDDFCGKADTQTVIPARSGHHRRGAWLHFLLHNWDWIPERRRGDLAAAIGDAFDGFSDWMGAFVAGEILGEKCADAFAAKRLRELARTARLPARELVPHGLEYLARATRDEDLKKQAIDTLRLMLRDANERCRGEALLSLKKLGLNRE
ncbi:MAG: hypothetical protein ACKVPX_06105 [Myxococcaceae bacterium]